MFTVQNLTLGGGACIGAKYKDCEPSLPHQQIKVYWTSAEELRATTYFYSNVSVPNKWKKGWRIDSDFMSSVCCAFVSP